MTAQNLNLPAQIALFREFIDTSVYKYTSVYKLKKEQNLPIKKIPLMYGEIITENCVFRDSIKTDGDQIIISETFKKVPNIIIGQPWSKMYRQAYRNQTLQENIAECEDKKNLNV